MGDNIYLGDRNGVRSRCNGRPTAMVAFSRADPAALYLPPIMDPVYGYASVNVEAQSRSLSSLLSWTKRLIGVRKSTKVFGRGTLTFIRPANRTVACLCPASSATRPSSASPTCPRSAQAVELDMSPWKGRIPREMLGRTRFPRVGDLPYLITLPPYGFFWFLLEQRKRRASQRKCSRARLPPWCWQRLGIRRLYGPSIPSSRTLLPAFLPDQRWFADKASRAITAKVSSRHPLRAQQRRLRRGDRRSRRRASQQLLFPAVDDPLDAVHCDRQEPGQRAVGRGGAARARGTLIDAAARA